MWEKLGALFSKIRTQKASLFLATWAHQACCVGRRELTGQPEDPGVPERVFLCGPFLVPGGNCVRPPVIFRALSMLRSVTRTSTVPTWPGSQMGSVLGKGRKGMTASGFAQLLSLPAGPLSSSIGFTFQWPPKGGRIPAGSPGSCRFADLHPSCAYFYVGWENRWLHPSC